MFICICNWFLLKLKSKFKAKETWHVQAVRYFGVTLWCLPWKKVSNYWLKRQQLSPISYCTTVLLYFKKSRSCITSMYTLPVLTIVFSVIEDSISLGGHWASAAGTCVGYETPGCREFPQLHHRVHSGRQQVLYVSYKQVTALLNTLFPSF